MIDPITASLVVGAGTNVAGKLTNAAATAAQKISHLASSKATSVTASFQDTYASLATSAFKKFFAAHPEIKTQLGDGPYNLTQNADGTLQISSQTTGNSMTLDSSTPLGQQATSLANSFELKNLQKGLEIAAV